MFFWCNIFSFSACMQNAQLEEQAEVQEYTNNYFGKRIL